MNAELSEEKMITQELRRIAGRSGRAEEGESGARCSLAASAECSYSVLITKTLSGKGGKRTRSKEEKLVQRENPPPPYECVALTGKWKIPLHLY